jgi:hypothetical protein
MMPFSGRSLLLGSTVLSALALAVACGSDSPSKSVPEAGGAGGGANGQAGDGPTADAGAGATVNAGGEAGSGPSGSKCVEPTGEGTTHGTSVTKNETWTAADSPHLVPDGTSIDATVTIEACAVVRIGAGKDVRVSGALVTLGEAQQSVRIERLDAAEAWGAISSSNAGGTLDLAYTSITGGGAVPENGISQQYGMLSIAGDRQLAPDPRLKTVQVTLADSASQGVLLTFNAAFDPASDGLSVTGAAGFPILIGARASGSVPSGTYDDNGQPAILVGTFERLGEGDADDVTLHERGVPYEIGGDGDTQGLEVGIGNGNPAKLTLEPGVELRFGVGQYLSIEGPDGVLSALGTAKAPITLTSSATKPAAGDWLGLSFFGEVATDTQVDHAVIAYAGAEETSTRGFSCGTPPAEPAAQIQTMGAVYLALEVAPTVSFITNTSFTDSASNGVDRGYTGDAVDFTVDNVFERVAFCVQTDPRPTVGVCDSPPACPQAK